jgi:predicted ester cyclase
MLTATHRKALACEFVETGALADFLEAAGPYRAAVPDLRLEVEEVVAEGERVVVLVRVRGTHTGELPGLPPTGRRVCVRGVEVLHLPDCEVSEHRSLLDLPDLMRQLGVLPTLERCKPGLDRR